MNDLFFKLLTPGISLFGFIITYFRMKKEFKNSVRKSLNEDRKKVYEEIYEMMDQVLNNKYIIYDRQYIISLEKLKPKAYIFSSKSVKEKYRSFCEMIYQKYIDYEKEFEGEDEENPLMIGAISAYQDKHLLDHNQNKILLNEILSIMRNDLAIED